MVVEEHLGDHGEDEDAEGGQEVAGDPPGGVVEVQRLLPGGHHHHLHQGPPEGQPALGHLVGLHQVEDQHHQHRDGPRAPHPHLHQRGEHLTK